MGNKESVEGSSANEGAETLSLILSKLAWYELSNTRITLCACVTFGYFLCI